MILEGDSRNKEIEIIYEDDMDNCWKTPPPRSVYSCTATKSTDNSTVSAITDHNKAPVKNRTLQGDLLLDDLVSCTAALENAAKELIEAEEKAQKTAKEKAGTEAEKHKKSITAIKEHTEVMTKNMIAEN
eukprot:9066854-Ditylum_brightwellii.AAC.1